MSNQQQNPVPFEVIEDALMAWREADNASRADRNIAPASFRILDMRMVGSHGFGYPGRASDIDLMVIYANPLSTYLCKIVDPAYAAPLNYKHNNIDVYGTDVANFLTGLYSCNLNSWKYLTVMDRSTKFGARVAEFAYKVAQQAQLGRAYFYFARSLYDDSTASRIERPNRGLGRLIGACHAMHASTILFNTPLNEQVMQSLLAVNDLPAVAAAIEYRRTGVGNETSIYNELSRTYTNLIEGEPAFKDIPKQVAHDSERLSLLRSIIHWSLTEF